MAEFVLAVLRLIEAWRDDPSTAYLVSAIDNTISRLYQSIVFPPSQLEAAVSMQQHSKNHLKASDLMQICSGGSVVLLLLKTMKGLDVDAWPVRAQAALQRLSNSSELEGEPSSGTL